MPQWIALVELQETATPEEYARLNDEMAKIHFNRSAIALDATNWKLPTGTYFRLSKEEISRHDLATEVSGAIETLNQPFWYFMTRYEDEDAIVCSERRRSTDTPDYTGAKPTIKAL